MKRKEFSLNKIVILTLVVVSTAVLTLSALASYYLERGVRLKDLRSETAGTAAQLASSVAVPMWYLDNEQMEKILSSALQDRDVCAVLLRHAASSTVEAGFVRDKKWRPVPLAGTRIPGGTFHSVQRIAIYGKELGSVEVITSARFVEEELGEFLCAMTAGMLVLNLFLVVIPFQLLKKTVLSPLKEIDAYARRVSAGSEGEAIIPEGRFFGELDTVRASIMQMTVSLADAQDALVHRLEVRVAERTRELYETQGELVRTARQAGMAEIATNVLHNVGNVLNSVNISAELLYRTVRDSKGRGLVKAVELMNRHAENLPAFFAEDAKGRLLPGYLEKLAQALEAEQGEVLKELSQLMRSVDHIKEIVVTQQSYAGSASMVEPVRVAELVQDALRMNDQKLSASRTTVLQDFQELPVLPLDKARVLQILVNLISNALQAMARVAPEERQLTLCARLVEEGTLRVAVRDCGEGIAAENLSRIFSHGFTTKKGGHGFGLHSCALAAKEMGGTLTAASDGPGEGAVFTLELPVALFPTASQGIP